eukprot:COSAG05_NODE_20180_length_282_cov_0.754098_1_plen_41_part_01
MKKDRKGRSFYLCLTLWAQKQYVDFKSVILDLIKAGFALAR